MIAKTEAIVLRVAPFSETSHVVTWIAKNEGRLVTVVKGAQRPKSPFLGQYDLFYTCELLYYTRDKGGLHIAREVSPIDARPRFRSDWKACAAASCICDFVYRLSYDGPHGSELFRLTTNALDFATAYPASPQLILWFELHLLDALGLAPQLATCPACGTATKGRPGAPSTSAAFSPARGGLLCPECASGEPHTTHATPDVVAILRSWQDSRTPRTAIQTRCTRTQLRGLSSLIGLFHDYHLDLPLTSRHIALKFLLD